ncbi:MAG: cell division protein CrgA [Corynebacteriales bacterium]|nr:cell division protein CrgA [Mycobacteriales bacterium]
MPKSRVRSKKVYTAPSNVAPSRKAAEHRPSPRWVPIVALALIAIGMVWLVTYYMTAGDYPVAAWGPWNIAAGFSGIVISLGIFTQWR